MSKLDQQIVLVVHEDDLDDIIKAAPGISGNPADASRDFFHIEIACHTDTLATYWGASMPIRTDQIVQVQGLKHFYPRSRLAVVMLDARLDTVLASLGCERVPGPVLDDGLGGGDE